MRGQCSRLPGAARSSLAAGAVDGGTARYHGLAQTPPAVHAGLAGAAVDQELVLVLARLAKSVAVVVDAAAPEFDGRPQGLMDAPVEAAASSGAKAVSGRYRPYAGSEAGFVAVDVAQAGHRALVEQQRLDRPAAALQDGAESALRQPAPEPQPRFRVGLGVGKRLRSQGGQGAPAGELGGGAQQNAAESPVVLHPQLDAR